jgi:hypothetical protein
MNARICQEFEEGGDVVGSVPFIARGGLPSTPPQKVKQPLVGSTPPLAFAIGTSVTIVSGVARILSQTSRAVVETPTSAAEQPRRPSTNA